MGIKLLPHRKAAHFHSRKMKFALTLLFACGALATPLRRGTEGEIDCGVDLPSRFQPYTRYTYKYVGRTTTAVVGVTHEWTGIKLEAKCSVENIGRCRYTLKVENVKLYETSGENQVYVRSTGEKGLKGALESEPLHFTMNRGRISKVLPPDNEPVYVTNMKRGILSALQLQFVEELRPTVFEEVDVTGKCLTRYTPEMRYKLIDDVVYESVTRVTKEKNLTDCTSRTTNNTMFNPTFYSNSTALSPLNSTSRCFYDMEESGYFKKIQCNETHLLKPFSSKQNSQVAGAMTNVTQELTLERVDPSNQEGVSVPESTRTTTLLFEHSPKQNQIFRRDPTPVRTILEELVTKVPVSAVRSDVAARFAELVFALRRVDKHSLKAIFLDYYNCNRERDFCRTKEERTKYQQYLVDALSQCGTSPCVHEIVRIVKHNKVNHEHARILLSGLHWIRQPTPEMFQNINELPRLKKNLPYAMYLSLGSMIRKYCEQKTQLCTSEQSPALQSLVYLRTQLGEKCTATPETVDKMIAVIKAFGNAGRLPMEPNELLYCGLDSNYRNVTVAVLQSLRTLPRPAEVQTALVERFRTYLEDPELRMECYLTLMTQPTVDDVIIVAETLDNEVNTQVGSFVSSHLTAINQTVERSQLRIRQVIQDAMKKRNNPLRKFSTSAKSYFSQKSVYSERWDVGTSMQHRVIYHPESLIPRSLAFNVTTDVLGAAINILETNLRMEDLEVVFKRLFGAEGFFPSNQFEDLFNVPPEEESNDVKTTNRLKRSVNNIVDLKTIDQKVNLRKLSPTAALSLRLFGMDVDMWTLKEMGWLNEDLDIPLFEVFEKLRELSRGINKTFTKSVLFLEDNFVVPTCLGVPLNVSVNGTAVGSLRVDGKADLLGFFWKTRPVIVNGKLRPSVSAEISGHMKLDAFHTSSGVLAKQILYTSTEVRGNLTYKIGENLKTYLKVNEKPQEVLHLSTRIFSQMNQKLSPIKGIAHRNMTGICTSEAVNTTRALGVDFCANISIPVSWYNTTVPYFPLTGPQNLSIAFKRTDPKLKTYKLEAIHKRREPTVNNTFITFSTPGATYERKISCNITSVKQKTFSSWNVTIGTEQVNTTTVGYAYDRATKDLNINVTLKTNITGNFTGKYYHKTCDRTQQVTYGLTWNLTVFNKTVNYSAIVLNLTNHLRMDTNFTVHNCTTKAAVTAMHFNTSIDKNVHSNMTGKLVLNITYQPLNFTWVMEADHNMTRRSTNVTSNMTLPYWSSPLVNHNITVNMTYINETNEKSMKVKFTSNRSSNFAFHFGFQNLTQKANQNISVYYVNVTYFNKTTSLNATFISDPQVNVSFLNVTHQNRSLTINTTWGHHVDVKNVTMNITFLNHSLVLFGVLKNHTTEKGMCLNGTYQNGTFGNYTLLSTCVSWHNTTARKSLLWNITNENRTMTLNTTWFMGRNLRGVFINCTYRNKTLLNITAIHTNSTTRQTLDFNITLGNYSAELNHTYFSTMLLDSVDRITSINISHRIRNGTRMVVNNSFIFTLYNTTSKKNLILNFTFWNKTYGTQMTYWNRTSTERKPWHILNVLGYTPNKTLNWTGSFKNTTEMLNVSSLLEYEPKMVLNQSFLLNRKLNHLNISLNLHPNITIMVNSSGTFNTRINITTNVTILNNTILWHGFASNKSLVSNLTMWNRTVELVSRTCNRTHTILLNVSTWHHTNQSAFNGSVTWLLNATKRMMYMNFTKLAYPLNATWYMISFSRNRYHFNSTVYRRNGTEVYNETSLEFREDGKLYKRYNATTFIDNWRKLNNATFNIPNQLLNMTVNVTSGSINVTIWGNHFRYVLRNVTHALKSWNYTTRNVTQNIRNLTIHLLNVTSRSLPSVYANYTTYYHNHTFNTSRFCEDLRHVVLNISHSNISAENVTEEVILILRNFTESINYTRLINNLTSMVTNETLPFINRTIGNVTLELRWVVSNWTEFGTNMTRNLTIWVNKTAVMLGNVSMVNKTINQHLINLIPVWQNMVNESLNGTIRFSTFLQNITLSLRNVTHNVTEYIINTTHPVLRNLSELILDRIKNHTDENSLLGGVLHPGWGVVAVTHNISLVNITVDAIHLLTSCNTSLEWLVPMLHNPVNITKYVHDMIKGKNLEETIRVFINRTLEMYNVTLRTPEFYLNKTYQLITNYTDLVTMVMNDTVNVLNVTSNKTLAEIIDAHLVKERNFTRRLWNMTLELLLSNISVPLNETWARLNLTAHYSNWTHSMPWHRFTVSRWNSTMFKLVTFLRNYTWEAYMRHYMPRFINTTANITAKVVHDYHMYYTIMGQRATNATVLNGTYQMVYLFPLQYRINYTQCFYDSWYSYNNMTAPVLNVTRNWTQTFLNTTWNMTVMALNLTSNWTRNVHNVTYTIVNTTISFINGSLVNETMRHYSYLPSYLHLHLMNYSMNYTHHLFNLTQMWINSSINMLYNSSKPLLEDLKVARAILEMQKEDVVKAFVPKDKIAVFFGRDHFYTFDRRYFRFPGYKTKQCQYLLTRDFRHGNFTVMTNGDSVTVLLNDADVTMYRDGKVRCYNKIQKKEFTELPVQLKHTTLLRNMTHITVNNTRGFELVCDMQHFVCSVAISGFYHNSTAGLLGTNNGEQSDDWLTPAGKNKTDVYSFINSWRVNIAGREECHWNVPDKNAEVDNCVRRINGANRCSELFKEKSSPFTKCFDKVDPRGFLTACENDVTSCLTRTPPELSHCDVTAAYTQACKRNGVDIEMPTECSQCSSRGETYQYGESWNVSPKVRDVDVIIISSEGRYMGQLTEKLPILVNNINYDHTKKQKERSVRFGLVGFSGRPPTHRPGHVHTINGKLLASAKEFRLGIANMDYMPANLPTNISDGFEGIRQATQYPFRPGATKIFILFTDSLRVEDSDLNERTIIEMMKDIGARLIVIGDYRFKRDVGVDSYGNYYTSKSLKTHTLSKELPLTDVYFRVMKETGGAVFNIKSFERKKKIVSTLVARELLKQVKENARLCNKCLCTRDEVGVGKPVCKPVPSC